ncbi:hypothetical protein DFJ74DRAFT_671454 [Hyaloraphidium curvatum]|nr:hypothetical protein DFJ74DRAFT_671454 [Hyaloraphidium curvatum]
MSDRSALQQTRPPTVSQGPETQQGNHRPSGLDKGRQPRPVRLAVEHDAPDGGGRRRAPPRPSSIHRLCRDGRFHRLVPGRRPYRWLRFPGLPAQGRRRVDQPPRWHRVGRSVVRRTRCRRRRYGAPRARPRGALCGQLRLGLHPAPRLPRHPPPLEIRGQAPEPVEFRWDSLEMACEAHALPRPVGAPPLLRGRPRLLPAGRQPLRRAVLHRSRRADRVGGRRRGRDEGDGDRRVGGCRGRRGQREPRVRGRPGGAKVGCRGRGALEVRRRALLRPLPVRQGARGPAGDHVVGRAGQRRGRGRPGRRRRGEQKGVDG